MANGQGNPTNQPVATAGGSGLPENIAGALSYFLGPITGVVFFLLDKQRPFVRFHAVQCLGVTIVWVVIAVVLMIVSAILGVIPVLGFLIGVLLNLGLAVVGFGLWLWLMFQAYSGKTWEVPGLGPHVRRISSETGGPSGGAAA
jgi:uncharacterized membrane protein